MSVKSKYKVLFLLMSCREKFFQDEYEVVKQTWAKDIIDGKYGDNVDIIAYDGWENESLYDNEKHILHLKCEDDTATTFKKTFYALLTVQKNYDYDFIFRTNTSTYVNVDLLIEFINTLDRETEDVWGGEIYSLPFLGAPYRCDAYLRGNSMLLSHKVIDILLTEGINFLYIALIDDQTIGTILNSYHIKKGEDYLDYIKNYPHGWYKIDTSNMETNNRHPVCQYHNTNLDISFIGKIITIQVKNYLNRENEYEKLFEIYNTYKKYKINNIEKLINHIYEFNKDKASIYITGGYISKKLFPLLNKNLLKNFQLKNLHAK